MTRPRTGIRHAFSSRHPAGRRETCGAGTAQALGSFRRCRTGISSAWRRRFRRGKEYLTLESKSMFDSLEEQIKRDDRLQISRKERVLKNVAIAALSVLLFGGLYFAVRLVE
jgi:hypothetical protein